MGWWIDRLLHALLLYVMLSCGKITVTHAPLKLIFYILNWVKVYWLSCCPLCTQFILGHCFTGFFLLHFKLDCIYFSAYIQFVKLLQVTKLHFLNVTELYCVLIPPKFLDVGLFCEKMKIYLNHYSLFIYIQYRTWERPHSCYLAPDKKNIYWIDGDCTFFK